MARTLMPLIYARIRGGLPTRHTKHTELVQFPVVAFSDDKQIKAIQLLMTTAGMKNARGLVARKKLSRGSYQQPRWVSVLGKRLHFEVATSTADPNGVSVRTFCIALLTAISPQKRLRPASSKHCKAYANIKTAFRLIFVFPFCLSFFFHLELHFVATRVPLICEATKTATFCLMLSEARRGWGKIQNECILENSFETFVCATHTQ